MRYNQRIFIMSKAEAKSRGIEHVIYGMGYFFGPDGIVINSDGTRDDGKPLTVAQHIALVALAVSV